MTAAPAGDAFPDELGGVQVLLNGVPAPLFFVGLYQVNVEVSDAVPIGDEVPLLLTIADVPSNEVSVAVAERE